MDYKLVAFFLLNKPRSPDPDSPGALCCCFFDFFEEDASSVAWCARGDGDELCRFCSFSEELFGSWNDVFGDCW